MFVQEGYQHHLDRVGLATVQLSLKDCQLSSFGGRATLSMLTFSDGCVD